MNSDKVVVTKIGESYQVQRGFHCSEMEVDGERTKENNVVVDHEPKSIVAIQFKTRTVKYRNEEGQELTVEQYNSNLEDYRKEGNATYEEYSWVFPNLEDEYKYKKFMQTWEAVNEDYEEREEREFIIETYAESPFPEIKSYRLIGQDKTKALFEYKPNLNRMVVEVAGEFGFTEKEDRSSHVKNTNGKFFSIPTHSRLQYLKVNGHYPLTNKPNKFRGISSGTLEECLKRREEHYNVLRDVFRLQETLIENIPVVEADRSWLLQKLRGLESSMHVIEPKRKSQAEWNLACRLLKELVKSLIVNKEEAT